jgi:hypothetical protein
MEEICKMCIRRFMLSTCLKRRQSISQQNSVSPYHNRDSMAFMPGRISVYRAHCVIRLFHTSDSHELHVTWVNCVLHFVEVNKVESRVSV